MPAPTLEEQKKILEIYEAQLKQEEEDKKIMENTPITIPELETDTIPYLDVKLNFVSVLIPEIIKLMKQSDNNKIKNMNYLPSHFVSNSSIEIHFSPTNINYNEEYYDEEGRPYILIIDWSCFGQWFDAISEPYYPWEKAINFAKVYCFNSFKDWFEEKFQK